MFAIIIIICIIATLHITSSTNLNLTMNRAAGVSDRAAAAGVLGM